VRRFEGVAVGVDQAVWAHGGIAMKLGSIVKRILNKRLME
jgi:hypothetical protein